MDHDARRTVRASSITDADIARAAARESLDVRTVIRALAGLPVRGQAGVRAARAVASITSPPSTAA